MEKIFNEIIKIKNLAKIAIIWSLTLSLGIFIFGVVFIIVGRKDFNSSLFTAGVALLSIFSVLNLIMNLFFSISIIIKSNAIYECDSKNTKAKEIVRCTKSAMIPFGLLALFFGFFIYILILCFVNSKISSLDEENNNLNQDDEEYIHDSYKSEDEDEDY